jgi:hypothetical protein
MPRQPQDPLRVRLLETIEESERRLAAIRDFGSTPGNAWLARSELQQLTSRLTDLEALLEDIRDADRENGY